MRRNLAGLLLASIASSISSAASARDLSNIDERFVAITAMAPIVAGMCKSQVVPTAFRTLADRLGVDDADALFKATLAAVDVIGKRDYRREDLIPPVTRLVGQLADTVAAEFSENKAGTCAKYLKLLREAGVVE